jgi:hypothetical protein
MFLLCCSSSLYIESYSYKAHTNNNNYSSNHYVASPLQQKKISKNKNIPYSQNFKKIHEERTPKNK